MSPPHFSQPSTCPTSCAPGAVPSAGGLGIAAPAHATRGTAIMPSSHVVGASASNRARRPASRVRTSIESSSCSIPADAARVRPPTDMNHTGWMNPSPDSPLACPLEVMKSAIALTGSLLLGIVALPVLLAGGDPPPPTICGQQAGSTDIVLATIRSLESGGNYRAQAAGATASGANQFLDSSWAGYDGYTHAKDAPPEVQDAKAAENVTKILNANGGDVTTVPVIWYIGHLPGSTSPEWDTVPFPGAGNRLTPRQYQARWMTVYNRLLDESTTVGTNVESSTATTVFPSGRLPRQRSRSP